MVGTSPPRSFVNGLTWSGLTSPRLGRLNEKDGKVGRLDLVANVDVRQSPLANVHASFERDGVVHCGVQVEGQRRRHARQICF